MNCGHSISSDNYEQRRKLINSHLKKIGKMMNSSVHLTTYVFRYSYANTCRELGYSKELIAEALGHEYGNAVTGIYLECFDQEKFDQMNSKSAGRNKGVNPLFIKNDQKKWYWHLL